MDFSNPFGIMVPRKMTAAELVSAIMQDIAAELDAVAVYQAHIDTTDDERTKKVLAHIPIVAVRTGVNHLLSIVLLTWMFIRVRVGAVKIRQCLL